ncbi:MAG TPA: ComF family protein [Methylibium sp.]|nr:ComF family protein [Methylibium sp.]
MPQRRVAPWIGRLGAALAGPWPNQCAVCRAATRGLGQRLCEDCIERFATPRWRCTRCALAVPDGVPVCGRCLREPPPWSRAVAACDYGHPWDGVLADFKFRAALDLAPSLADLLARTLGPAPPPVDLLLPVPLAPARLRERGYNQAARLAAALGRTLRLAVRDDLLLRIVDTPHQLSLPRENRIANLRGAFAVEPLALAAVRGRRIAVLDDVMTTGATLAEAARTLRAAGAAEVEAWVVARTPD